MNDMQLTVQDDRIFFQEVLCMNIRELLSHNQNVSKKSAAYLNVIAHCPNSRYVDIVNANEYCCLEEDKHLLDAEIASWYLCHDQHDIDTIELRIELKL